MRPRRRMHSLALPLALLAFATTALAAFENDFSAYPQDSQQCLSDAADASSCDGDTVSAMNECLCGNGGNFVLASAQCVAQDDPGDLESVYEIMSLHCSDSNTPLSVSKADFLAAKSSTTTGASATKTKTSSATNTKDSSSESPSVTVITSVISGSVVTATVTNTGGHATETGSGDKDDKDVEGAYKTAKIGIIAGSVVGGLAVIGIMVFFILRYRRRRSQGHEEAHPMLSQSNKFSGPGGPGSISTHPGSEDFASTQGWKADPYQQDWGTGTGNWPPAYGQQTGYGQYPHSPNDFTNAYSHSPSPNLQQHEVYEMAAPGPDPQRPVEMPSNSTQYSGAGWGSGPYEPYRAS